MQNILKSFVPKLTYNIKTILPVMSTSIMSTQVTNRHERRLYISNRDCSTSVTQPIKQTDGSFISKIMKKLGFMDINKTRMKVTAYMLYESVADKIDYVYFFEECKLPDTFNSWFLVTELHVWMLLVRAMAEGCEKGSDGRSIRNNIVEALWADVATRTKKLRDINSYGLRQQIQLLSEQFQYALIGYDEGLVSNDMVLAGALWRRFFEQQCDDPQIVERLVIYIRKQISALDKIPSEMFLQLRDLDWLPLKDTL